ncbi:hypothetical protein EGT07_24370 [Herbaspirillum sp. HC18]|nr:hypothetical protein EGT07_24370 [Herbaspirillum sp. HC18]
MRTGGVGSPGGSMGWRMNLRTGHADAFYRPVVAGGTASDDLLSRYLVSALAIVLTMVYLNLPDYTNALYAGLPPKYMYVGFFVLLLPLMVRFKTWVPYLLSPFALWVFVLVSVNAVYWLSDIAEGKAVHAEFAAQRIQTLILALMLGMAVFNVRAARFEWMFPLLAMLLPLLIFIDFSRPGLLYPVGTEGSVLGRSAATFINPTTAGEAMLVLFLLACPVLKLKQRVALMLVVGAGVLLTLSRSAILAWLALWIVLSITRVLPRSAALVLAAALSMMPLLLGSLETYFGNQRDIGPALADIQQRLDFFSTGNMKDGSAVERSMVLRNGWDTFLNNFVVGTGPGSTEIWPHAVGNVGTHNQFVMLAAEYGLCGIAMWLALGWILWHGRYFEDRAIQQSMFLLFVLMTPFTHNLFDYLFWLLTFALVSGRRRV